MKYLAIFFYAATLLLQTGCSLFWDERAEENYRNVLKQRADDAEGGRDSLIVRVGILRDAYSKAIQDYTRVKSDYNSTRTELSLAEGRVTEAKALLGNAQRDLDSERATNRELRY